MFGFFRFSLFIVGAAVLFGATMGLYWEQFYSNLQTDGEIATATVTQVDAPDKSARSNVHFSFQAANGKTYNSERRLTADGEQFLRTGAKIRIRYLPSTPSVHEFVVAERGQAALGRWSQYLLLALFGAGLILWASDTPRLRKPRLELSDDDFDVDEAVAAVPATGGAIVKRFR